MTSYPVSLPAPKIEGFTKKPRTNTVSTPTAQGYQRRRRRFTGIVEDINVTLPPLTTAQLATFRTFYNDTCESGTLEFDWEDFTTPEPRTACTYRFGEATPEYSYLSAGLWRVTFQLEQRST